MNHREAAQQEYSILHLNDFPQWQTTIATVLVLLFVFYGWPHLTYETTIKRRVYGFGKALVPDRFTAILQRYAPKSSGSFQTGPSDARSGTQRRGSTLNQLYEGSGVSSMVQRARTLSGLDRLAPKIVEGTFSGLGNWDNSCFQNSVLQGLASLQAFKVFIDRSQQMTSAVNLALPTHDALNAFLEELQREMPGRNTIWPPAVLRSMNTWQQQDAQEYLIKIMDAVEKEAIKYQNILAKRLAPGIDFGRGEAHNSDNIDIETRMCQNSERAMKLIKALLPQNPLEGTLSQALECQTCRYSEGISLMSFNCLTLNLGLVGDCYLEDMLDAHTEAELIEGVECDECTRISHQTNPSTQAIASGAETPENKPVKTLSTKAKQILFGRLPQNLVIHINRSIFDDWGNQRKNTSYVRFPAILKIGEEWVAEPLTEAGTDVQAVYELRCVVTHQGRHDNGHYVACGKRGKEWFIFNDEVVTKTSEEAVLARGHVFMLFYEQIDRRPYLEIVTTPSEGSVASNNMADLYQNSVEAQVAVTD